MSETGPPLRLSDLAKLSGFTRHKLYGDIERGDLRATRVKCGQSFYWMVDREEAARYLGQYPVTLAS